MDPKGTEGPIVGAQMSDLEQIAHPSGLGILADENNILKIDDSEGPCITENNEISEIKD